MISFKKIGNGFEFNLIKPSSTYSTEKIDQCSKKLDDESLVKLVEENHQYMKTRNINDKSGVKLQLDEPLRLFGECVTCDLSRKKNPMFRKFFQSTITDHVNNHSNETLNITSYYSVTGLLEVIMFSSTGKRINLNMVGQKEEFFTLIQDPKHNPHANKNEIHYNNQELEWKDDNIERMNWLVYNMARTLKLLEWFHHINPNIKIVFYPSCEFLYQDIQDISLNIVKSDIFYGLDYIDSFSDPIDFIKYSPVITKQGGLIFSMKTGGDSMSEEILLDVSVNKDDYNLVSFKDVEKEIEDYRDDIKSEVLKMSINKGMFRSVGNKKVDIIVGNKVFKFSHGTIGGDGDYDVYVSDNYRSIQTKCDKLYKELYQKFGNRYNDNKFLIKCNGINSVYFKMYIKMFWEKYSIYIIIYMLTCFGIGYFSGYILNMFY